MLSGIDLLGDQSGKSGLNLLSPDPSYSFEPSEASEPYLKMVGEAETKYKLPKHLLSNVIQTESQFKSDAVSEAGATGIAQIMPEHHPDVDPTDPIASIDYAGGYLRKLYDQFGNWDKAIAAYNTGPGNLNKYGMENLPEETRDYLEKVNAAKVSEEVKATSGLDLLKPETESTIEQPSVSVTLEPIDAKSFYGTHAVSPPFQGLAPMIWSPEIASYMGKQGFGPKPEGGWDELGTPLDKDGKPYYEPEKATDVIAETLQGLSSLATHPMEVVRGGLDFFLSIPGFLTGILSASSAVTKRTLDTVIMGTDTTLEDLYNISAEEMQKSMEFFDPGKKLLTGEPTPESELTAQVIMAPMTGLSMIGHKVADYEGFKDYPNVRGAARFAGDIAGLATMGFLLHKGSKAEFTRDVERVVKEADKIIVEEQAVQGIPNEIIKQAEQKSIDARKVQIDLEAKKLAEKTAEEALVKGEAAKQAEGVIKAKSRVEPEVEIKPEVKIEPPKVELPKVEEVKPPEGQVFTDDFITELKGKDVESKVVTEVDRQTGVDLSELKGEVSPFFQGKEKTEALKEIYDERAKSVESDPELLTQKLINDVNRWYHGDESVPIGKVREMLSTVATRADELRADFITGQDHHLWKETITEAADWARNLDRLKIEPTVEPTKLYTGISPQEVIKSARKVAEYTQKARGMKGFKPTKAAKALREEFTRAFVDRSGNIRRKLLDNLGTNGYEVVQAMYLARGSSSIAAKNLMQMRKEIYRGLSKVEKKILDDLILADRMIDIGKYKTGKEFKHPDGMTVEDFVRYRQAYRYKAVNGFKDLTSKEADSISQKAKGYFDWMRKALKDMLDAELITEKEFNDLASHNYRRIKLVDVYDQRYKTKVGKKVRTVYDSGVEALSKGRETDIYESSSEIMALEVFNRTYGRILNNKANKTLLDLARRDSANPFVRVREKKGDMIPTGWNRIFVYEKGERKSIYISPEMSKEWVTTNPDLSYRQSQLIRYASGSPVLRTFATGINWGFALANLPRDVMHTWFAARVFENGKWKPIYSSTLPMFNMQIGRDLVTTFSDAALRKGSYERYIEEGGGMEFLVHQGRLFQRGRHIEGPLDAIYNFMGYFGETSEIMSRLAIRERVLRRKAKEGKTTVKELDKRTKESKEATFAARDYMDFGQGGWATKAADNAIPYLNASIQGTRGLWRAFKDNPAASTYKLAQFATIVSGLYIAMGKLTPETSEALRGNISMQNNLCIPLGDDFGFEDSKGQMRYPFFKIPLDPGQKFFKTFFEASTDKWLGNPVDVNRVVDSLKEQSPVGVTELPPSISGVLGYATNKDFWMNEDIWRKTDKPLSWPKSKEEYIPGVTPEAYVDVGEITGLSPERLRYTVEELTTSGTMWSWMLGEGYDATFGDLSESQKEQHLAEVLSKTPVIKRFFGITNPYSQFAGPIDKAEEESSLNKFVQNRGLDMRSEGYLFKDNTSKKEVFDYIKTFKDIDVVDRLIDRFEFQVKTKDLPNRTFWLRLKGLSTDARARVFVDRMDQLTPEKQNQLRKEMGKVVEIGGVITDSFLDEVGKLHQKK